MGLSTLSANQDTRLIKHGNTVFKLKLTFTDPAEQGTQILVDLHSEIEEALGAVIFMVESGTSLVKIQTEHFLICPILKIWKMGKRLGFLQFGEELDVFPKVIHLIFNFRKAEESSAVICSGVQSQKDQLQRKEISHQLSEHLQQDSVEKQSAHFPENQSQNSRDSSSTKITVQSNRSKYSLRSASHQAVKLISGFPDSTNTNANNSSTFVPTRSNPRNTLRKSVMTSPGDRVGVSSSATEMTQGQNKEHSKPAAMRSSWVLRKTTHQRLNPLTSETLSSNREGKKENHPSQRLSSQSHPLGYDKTLVESPSHKRPTQGTLAESASHECPTQGNLAENPSRKRPTQRLRRVYELRQNLSRSTLSEERRLRTLASGVDNKNESLERSSSPSDRKRTVLGFQQKDRHMVELGDIQEEAKLQMLASNDRAVDDDKGKRVKRKRSLAEMFTDSVITPIKRALRQSKA